MELEDAGSEYFKELFKALMSTFDWKLAHEFCEKFVHRAV